MTVNEFLKSTYKTVNVGLYKIQLRRPSFICNDGFTGYIDVNVGRKFKYETNVNYKKVYYEPNSDLTKEEEEMMKKFETFYPLDDVYYYIVPIELLDKVLEKHGGIVGTC